MSSTSETVWHGMDAVAIEGDVLRATVVPGLGAKIASLIDKRTNHEWLVGPDQRPVRAVPYGATWAEHDMSGWDEMFPTINACNYPGPGEFMNTPLPDHGEVWSAIWSRQPAADDELAFGVSGHNIHYRLVRTARIDGPSLHLRYRLLNQGTEPLSYLWAAHPQFTCEPDTRILLPSEVNEVVRVYDPRMGWDAKGAMQSWPLGLDRVGDVAGKDCRKFFVPAAQPVDWAGLVGPKSGHWLRVTWDSSVVSYLGIWVDEGCFNTVSTVALEPTTGFYDSLATAWQAGRVATLPARATQDWEVSVSVGIDGNALPA